MVSVIMGTLDRDEERIAFDTKDVRQILSQYKTHTVYAEEEGGLLVELGGEVHPVKDFKNNDEVRPFFIILKSGIAYNVSDYQILFDVKNLANQLLSGTDATGHQYLCRKPAHATGDQDQQKEKQISLKELDEKIDSGEISQSELKALKSMIQKMKEGDFFEALTMEFSGKIKEIATEFIDFRKDIQKRIEPDIVEIAARDIPEASYQLEGINETLEKSTMKIMDINEEQMEIANRQLKALTTAISGNGNGASALWDSGRDMIQEMKGLFTQIPEEAKQVCQFVIPPIENAHELITRKREPDEIRDILSEPLATIKDLIVDFGNGNEALARLNHLSTSLSEMLEGTKEGATGGDGDGSGDLTLDQALEVIEQQIEQVKKIGDLSLSMMEPLSFQDLVGQRIQKIIRLVKSMEIRIEELIISFGIKIKRHKEDPSKSYEELKRDVEQYKSELKGPQNEGEGLGQSDIDDLLTSL